MHVDFGEATLQVDCIRDYHLIRALVCFTAFYQDVIQHHYAG